MFFRHLSCTPKKGNRKKGARRKFLTPCSVVLTTMIEHHLPYSLSPLWERGRGEGGFGNSPFGLRHPKCLTFGLGRTAKFPHGEPLKALDLNLYPKPRTSLDKRSIRRYPSLIRFYPCPNIFFALFRFNLVFTFFLRLCIMQFRCSHNKACSARQPPGKRPGKVQGESP